MHAEFYLTEMALGRLKAKNENKTSLERLYIKL